MALMDDDVPTLVFTSLDLLVPCLEKVPKVFSHMVVKNGDESHGGIRKNHLQQTYHFPCEESK